MPPIRQISILRSLLQALSRALSCLYTFFWPASVKSLLCGSGANLHDSTFPKSSSGQIQLTAQGILAYPLGGPPRQGRGRPRRAGGNCEFPPHGEAMPGAAALREREARPSWYL